MVRAGRIGGREDSTRGWLAEEQGHQKRYPEDICRIIDESRVGQTWKDWKVSVIGVHVNRDWGACGILKESGKTL